MRHIFVSAFAMSVPALAATLPSGDCNTNPAYKNLSNFPSEIDCGVESIPKLEKCTLESKVLEQLNSGVTGACSGISCKVQWRPAHALNNVFVNYEKTLVDGKQVIKYVGTYHDEESDTWLIPCHTTKP